MIDLGAFAIFNLLGFGFLTYGTQKQLPVSGALHMLSMVFFFGLAFYMLTDQDIGQATTYTDGTTTWTEIKIFMIDRDTNLLVWVYLGMGTISLLSFMFLKVFRK